MNRPALLVALLLPIALLASSCNEPSGHWTVPLDRGWEFRWVSEGVWHPASVPGCVHTDLLAAGIIENPFFGTNESGLQWIENVDWEYRTVFDAPAEFLERERVDLEFDGLDTYADVYLNGTLVLRADNMFREWRVPCEGILRARGNELRVYFHSPVAAVKPEWDALGRELPGGPRVLTRKAAYHYGWDWAPRFVTSGIWRPARLRAWDQARIADFRIVQKRLDEKSAELAAVFEIEALDQGKAFLTVRREGRIVASVFASLEPGMNVATVDFTIPEPKLWWPNGLGAPELYEVSGEIRSGDLILDLVEKRIGLRTIELVREPDDTGESFYFRVNGVSVFMKGANFVPMDSFIPRVTDDRYESLVAIAAGAGMNMLRVWGGGVYENERFYDLCDEYGILVWQDFMFACAMYPGDSRFLDNVREEATGVVRRLRNHPCLALWCGNNEIDEAWHRWGWQRQYGYSAADSAQIWGDYVRLFHELLPGVVAELDPETAYWPSSPSYGRADPRSLTEGDSHYWGVWHDGEPFEAFLGTVPRFMSEFGFQSFPTIETIEGFTTPEDRRIDSPAMLAHQKHPRGNEIIERYLKLYYREPRDFESFVYVGQLLQAEGMKTAIEAHRRARPRCMGSLFWQLNDCWPAASWSSMDYEGDPKALLYFATDAFSEVLVSPVVENDTVRVYVISDRAQAFEGLLRLRLLDFRGNVIWESSRRLTIRPGSSRPVFAEGVARVLAGENPRRVVLSAELSDQEGIVSRNLLYFVPPRELDLPKAQFVGTGIEPAGGSGSGALIISFQSDVLVKNVRLSAPGLEGYFERNYFDVLPGTTARVRFFTDEKIEDLDSLIQATSLVDTY